MIEKEFRKGDVIFRQGEEGKTFFRILEGSVGIFGSYQEQGERKLTELSVGQIFGEMALIDCYPRSATAVSLSDNTKVQEIEQDEVIEYLRENPGQLLSLMRYLSDRLRAVTDDYTDVCAVIQDLGKEDQSAGGQDSLSLRDRIRNYIADWKNRKNAPDSLTAEYGNDLKAANHTEGFYKKVQEYPKGTVICREGMTVHCMYDIHWGRVGVYTGFGTDKEQLITELCSNTFFGEAGMISDEPRSATVVALEDTTVEIIYMEDLEELLEKNPNKIDMILRHLTFRLRRISDSYLEACELVGRAEEEKEQSGAVSPELMEEIRTYQAKSGR